MDTNTLLIILLVVLILGAEDSSIDVASRTLTVRNYTIATMGTANRGRSRVKTHPLLGRLRA